MSAINKGDTTVDDQNDSRTDSRILDDIKKKEHDFKKLAKKKAVSINADGTSKEAP